MNHIPNLDELLNYGEEYQYPDLIMSDYFQTDNGEKKQNKKPSNENSKKQEKELPNSELGERQQSLEEEKEEQSIEQTAGKEKEEQSTEQTAGEEKEEQSTEQTAGKEKEEQSTEQTAGKEKEEQSTEQTAGKEKEEQSTEQTAGKEKEEQSTEQTAGEEKEEQSAEQSAGEEEKQKSQEEYEKNNLDDLMNNYDESENGDDVAQFNERQCSASDKLKNITTTRIYRVFKQLVSLNYERYQKGSYKCDKKEIVKHYLTQQKFRIIDDLVSPTFKPDVYVFDLSPSNNESLEMYVNAISSVAVKNSLIYLTYNDCILRKLRITKESLKSLDVNAIVNSDVQSYSNLECTIFSEYRSLYDELKDIKNRKIYIFSDFDISQDISRLSQENPDIVWFSTEQKNTHQTFFYREYPTSYIGYYVETFGIEDIEKFVKEKNKEKYKRRFI